MKQLVLTSILAICGFSTWGAAQNPAPAKQDLVNVAEGIPVESALVRQRCGGCHRPDAKNLMTRISYRRATPENWERTIKRMIALNHVTLSPEDARNILKYLADHQGLAPEELRPIAFEEERRTVDFSYTADETTSNLCSSCHSIGRVLSERRTKEEWQLLISMHRGYYPLVDTQPMNGGQGFMRSNGRGGRAARATQTGADGNPPDDRNPVDRAIEHLTKTFPLNTPEWSAWTAAMQPPKLAGRWAVAGSEIGKGPVVGVMTVTADSSSPENFTTETHLTVTRTGETITRSGKALVYTGYQWRGRSNDWREVLFIERDWKQMWGRWFSGAYDETGLDVTLTRLTEPTVLGASVTALKTGATAQRVRIFGANLPSQVRPEDVAFGPGVTVTKVVSAAPEEVAVDVDVAATAPVGARDGSIAGAVKPALLVVYDKIDGIKVLPESGLARVGGAVFPKQVQQFEAVGVNYGPDGKPDTADDLDLGFVNVSWSLEEYPTTFNDDDVQFVGTVDQNGLFTPNLDGPNPKRSGNRNNVGDVWVVAEFPGTKPLRARAHLLVTVPLYMNWFAEESK
ncbi:MAG TPA: quinohemoprotein amine dehydrogenase subunit alpha [Vicinamibacterales bacterium]